MVDLKIEPVNADAHSFYRKGIRNKSIHVNYLISHSLGLLYALRTGTFLKSGCKDSFYLRDVQE